MKKLKKIMRASFDSMSIKMANKDPFKNDMAANMSFSHLFNTVKTQIG
jgi:hypothetical protein